MTEIWKPIPGYPAYEVSDHGRVRSYYTHQGTGRSHIGEKPRRFLSQNGRLAGRYPQLSLWRDGIGRKFPVHQLVMLAFAGPRPEGLEVCHNDGNPENNHLSNLRYDTSSANKADTIRMGNHRYKLTDDQVREIKERLADGDYTTQEALGKEYGVSRPLIGHIKCGIRRPRDLQK